ncbi:unnamed protein product [Symbiodinium sp. CCMP2456]|nr:unnamed protein product [Symbiodinium sp. CCMP2456]
MWHFLRFHKELKLCTTCRQVVTGALRQTCDAVEARCTIMDISKVVDVLRRSEFSSSKVALLIGFLALVRSAPVFWSTVLSLSFLLWYSYDLTRACDEQKAALWAKCVLPVRVAGFAEQFGKGFTTWGPMARWAPESDSVASVLSPDFSHASAVKRFDAVRRHVQCVFAAKAKLWGNDWCPQACGAESEEAVLVANVALCLPRLLRFCLMVKQGAALDGFVFEVRGRNYCDELGRFAMTVRKVLAGFSAGDPSGTDCFKGRVEGRGWYFQFAREPIFVTTFAPCYGSGHPRYQFNQHTDSCFILMQPEESFLRHDLPPDKPRSATNWEAPADVRDRIRANFRRHGREYRIPETTSYPPADFIVAPMDALHDAPVRFWEQGGTSSDGL